MTGQNHIFIVDGWIWEQISNQFIYCTATAFGVGLISPKNVSIWLAKTSFLSLSHKSAILFCCITILGVCVCLLFRNLLYVKNYPGDVTELGLDFSVVNENLGVTSHWELKPNGRNIVVNNDNRIEYVHLMADYKLNRQVSVLWGRQEILWKCNMSGSPKVFVLVISVHIFIMCNLAPKFDDLGKILNEA